MCPGCSATCVHGLAEAGRQSPDLVGIGVDSWAVDYGLLREAGHLAGLPYHYRDTRDDDGVEPCTQPSRSRIYHARNGLQFLPFNTVYQLAADGQRRIALDR